MRITRESAVAFAGAAALAVGCLPAHSEGRSARGPVVAVSSRADGPVVVGADGNISPTITGLRGLSYIAAHPALPVYYATKESGSRNRIFVAFAQTVDGWTELGRATTGTGPVHIALDADGRTAFVAGYTDGTLTRIVLDERGVPRTAKTVRLPRGRGADPSRQQGPHAHSSAVSADDRYVVVADLGTDALHVFDASSLSLIRTERLPPGTGPRTAAFVDPFTMAVSEELRGGLSWWSFRDGRLTFIRRVALERSVASDVIVRPDALAGQGPQTLVISRATDELIGVSANGEERRWATPGCGARFGAWTADDTIALACTRGGDVRHISLGAGGEFEERARVTLGAVSAVVALAPP